MLAGQIHVKSWNVGDEFLKEPLYHSNKKKKTLIHIFFTLGALLVAPTLLILVSED